MKIIEAEGINKFFGTGQNRVPVLKDMSFACLLYTSSCV